MEDCYKILGIQKNSSQEDIEKAYRSLVLKYHPDKNIEKQKEYTEKFKKIQEAYEYLMNSKASSFFRFSQKNSVDDIFNNIFNDIFGDQKKNNNSTRVRLKINLEEAYLGCKKEIEIDKHEFCKNCEGTGGSSWISCKKCEGKDFIQKSDSILYKSSCTFCDGKGNTIVNRCENCKGNGFVVKEKNKVKVEIPAGIKDGTQIRLANEGSGGGDLYVVVNINKHSVWERRDNDLLCDFEVSFYYLVFGGLVDLDLFGEKIKVKLKPRTKTGSKITIKNFGMPFLENQNLRGNLELNIQLKLPKEITKDYKELMEKFNNLELIYIEKEK